MSWVVMTVLSLWGLILAAGPAQAVTPASPEDAFIAGYAAALLEREFKLTVPSLAFSRGVVTLDAADLAGTDRERAVAALTSIRGVQGVTILAPGVTPPVPAAPENAPAVAATPSPQQEPLPAGVT